MSIETLVRMTAPVRDAFDIPYHDLGDRSAPPRIALVAGLHGNELNGIFVLSRLAAFLTEVAAGARPMLRLRERVVVIPAVNVLGVNTRRRVWPFDGTDLNRMFPGYDGGETTQRIAHAVFAVTEPAQYRVDLHSSNLEFEELPQVRLYDPNEEERRTARLFGLPAIIERPGNTIFSATLGHAWREAGGANFVIQAGQAGELQLGHCERVFRGLIAFLDRIGVVEGAGLADDEEEPHHFGPRQTLPVIARAAGLFVTTRTVGTWLTAGDTIGSVFDPFDGSARGDVVTPVSGLLTGLRRQPMLFEGDLIARLQTREEVRDGGADTYLSGHGQ